MERKHYLNQISRLLAVHPICAILGPRQVGKTTLAKQYIETYFSGDAIFFDLENAGDLASLDNPMVRFASITNKIIVIDEIQMRPDLFPALRVIVDQDKKQRKFLILGSASRDLIRQSSETLAGRIGYLELCPFLLFEAKDVPRLINRGGYPRSYLALDDDASYSWRQNYIMTFLEKDIPSFGFNIPPAQLRRFWYMLAHYHGQLFNASEIARSLGVSGHVTRSYLDILAGTFMIRILVPWIENLKKRQVKSPKIYFRDTGILNALIGLSNEQEWYRHPRMGSFWEGFALEQIIQVFDLRPQECFFWATHSEAELDLLFFRGGKRFGFEFKFTDSPRTTKSMHSAITDLSLDHLGIIYPGDKIFPLTDKISVYGLETIVTGEFMKAFNIKL